MTNPIKIDLRSDTVTLPTWEMRDAMANAMVGDDCYGEDPNVATLEQTVAELLGKEAAVFMPSGTMANQIALRLSTCPGDEVIADRHYHLYFFESAQASQLAGVTINPTFADRGIITPSDIEQCLKAKPRNDLYARATLLWLENTISCSGGVVYPPELLNAVTEYASHNSLRVHLDGARLFNAVVRTGVPADILAKNADTVMICFSKGLGAPFGAALAGSAIDIKRARTYRKWYGGALHQSGIMAAGALFGLENNLHRLPQDHRNAQLFALLVGQSELIQLTSESPETNMVYFKSPVSPKLFADFCRQRGVFLFPWNEDTLRAVFHLNISEADTVYAASIIKEVALQLINDDLIDIAPHTRNTALSSIIDKHKAKEGFSCSLPQ